MDTLNHNDQYESGVTSQFPARSPFKWNNNTSQTSNDKMEKIKRYMIASLHIEQTPQNIIQRFECVKKQEDHNLNYDIWKLDLKRRSLYNHKT
jgi:hypothetical protein